MVFSGDLHFSLVTVYKAEESFVTAKRTAFNCKATVLRHRGRLDRSDFIDGNIFRGSFQILRR